MGPSPRPDPGGDWFEDNPPPAQETPQEELTRFERDYNAQDREQVLAAMRAAMGQTAAPAPGTPGGAPSTPPATGGVSGSGASAEFGRQWLASGGRTVTDLRAFADRWNAANPNARVTLGGSKGDKVYGPGGTTDYWADAIESAGINGGIRGLWNTSTGEGGSGGQQVGDFGSLSRPYGRDFYYPPFNQHEFAAPSIEDARNSPGYQFQLETGVKALDQGAASRGVSPRSGPQQKALVKWAMGLGDSTYGNVYDRSANTFGLNTNLRQRNYENELGEYLQSYNIFRTDNNDIFDRHDRLAQRGTQAAQSATS